MQLSIIELKLLRKAVNNMEKTKCGLFIFVLIFAAVIAGSVAILNVSDNQTIDDFELEMVEGYDPSVIEGICFDVKYGLSDDGYYEKGVEGDKCEFQYIDGKIQKLQFTEAKEPERRGAGIQPYEMALSSYEWISDDRVVAIKKNSDPLSDEIWVMEFDVTANNSDTAHLPQVTVIKGIEPEGTYTEDNLVYMCKKGFWSTDTHVYFFENGVLCKVSRQELMDLSLVYATRVYETEPVYYEPIYTVPEEVDVIVGYEGGELFYLVGLGDVTTEGYTLYTYIVDVTTGETLDRQCYEKKLSDKLAKDNQTILDEINAKYIDDPIVGYTRIIAYDYLAKDSYGILTITQPTGYQDMFVIEKIDSESEIHNFNVSDLLAENLYISGLLEAENNGNDTLYLIYAEGQINKLDYDANWSRRVIMNLEERLSVECPVGYNIMEVGYNGVTFIAIQNGEVVYKGYFASETSKALGDVTKDLLEGYNYYFGLDLPKAYVEQITISVQ